MKKLIIILTFNCLIIFANAQVKVNQNAANSSINISSAFMDASSSSIWNASANQGKGMLFPRVNLVNFSAMSHAGPYNASNNPNYFDGLLVFNTATGIAPIGGDSVYPGYYYYRNTTTSANSGHWISFKGLQGIAGELSAFFDDTQILNNKTWTSFKINSELKKKVDTSSFASVALSGDYNDLTNKPTTDGSETKVTAGINVTVTGAGTTASPYVINSIASGSVTHYLGEEYLGGIIFELYTTSDGIQHGLIVSKTEAVRYYGSSTLINANRSEDGAYNTSLMPTGVTTARSWVEALGTGWYLPSIDELYLLCNRRYYINKTSRAINSTLIKTYGSYLSSTEYENNSNYAWGSPFPKNEPGIIIKSTAYSVRAVKAF